MTRMSSKSPVLALAGLLMVASVHAEPFTVGGGANTASGPVAATVRLGEIDEQALSAPTNLAPVFANSGASGSSVALENLATRDRRRRSPASVSEPSTILIMGLALLAATQIRRVFARG